MSYKISVKDVIVPENKAIRASTSLPNYIVYRMLDVIGAMTYECCELLPGYMLYNNGMLAHDKASLIESNGHYFDFVKRAIMRLIQVIKPSELVVYTVRYDIAILKIGSYLVIPSIFSGIRVLNDDEEFEALQMILTKVYAIKSLMENTRYNIDIDLTGKNKNSFNRNSLSSRINW